MIINYGKQTIDKSDIKSVIKTLKNDYLTQGPEIIRFEKKLNDYFGSKYCSVVSNGSAALYIAAKSLGWKRGDHIITTANTFLASASCILHTGAKPEFVDINKNNYTIDTNKTEDRIKKLKKKVKAIIAVDYAGHPCDWVSLKFLAKKYNLRLINDNCHALGAKINNDKKYACKYADIVTHSYHPVKNITTGEGGAILTNNYELFQKILIFRNNGMVKQKDRYWEYRVNELSMNFRITDIQCALGISQLKKLNVFIKKRNKIAKEYNNIFKEKKNIIIPKLDRKISHAYHLYPLLINFNKTKITKKKFFYKLKEKGINLQVHYVPLYYHKLFSKFTNKKKLPVTEDFYNKQISLPIYPELKEIHLKKVVKEILNLLY